MKDDNDEVISKKALSWLTVVSGIATILTTIFGLFGDNKKAQLWAFVAAIILALISSGIYFYQRRRAAKLKIAEASEPLSASAALRGLLPFEEGDELPGRGRDVQDIFTLVSSSTFRFGVLWGESGCGKTSLLRAGLVPRLKNEKYLPLYIHKPTNDPLEAIRLALAKELGESTKKSDKDIKTLLKAATPKGKKIIILFDQFEEFFLTNRTPSSRVGFIKWLGSIVNDEKLPIAFLIGIRGDFFSQLHNFSSIISEPTSTRTTYQLQNFDSEKAKQIFSAAAKADGIPFEPELILAVIKELEAEDFIRPAELQVVGTRLKRKNITRLSQYDALGGARGILSSYINEEIKQSANEQAARLVLRLMCADAVETKSPTDLSMDDILRGIGGTGKLSDSIDSQRQAEVRTILNQFETARVLIHTDDDKYNLVHDYLAPYVRTATEGSETNTERANRLLQRYVAEYREDPKTRIPFARVRLIQKYANAEALSGEKALKLIRKSEKTFYSLVSIPIILIASLYIFLANSYYFGIDKDKNIVIISGNPQWKFVPGFDRVVIQLDFRESDLLDPNFVFDIRNGLVTGFWVQKTEGGYQIWGEQLADHLRVIPRAQTLRWLDQTTRTADILIQIISDSKIDIALRSDAVYALKSLAQAKPEIVDKDMLNQLIEFVITKSDANLYSARSNAAIALESFAQAKPEIVDKDMLNQLTEFVVTKSDANLYFVRSNAGLALGSLAQAKPETVDKDMLNQLIEFVITDSDASLSDMRSNAAITLGSLVQAKPEIVDKDMLNQLIEFVITDSDASLSNVGSNAASALGFLSTAQPETIDKDMLNQLIKFVVTNSDVSLSNERTNAASVLGAFAQAKPEIVDKDMLNQLIEFVITNSDASLSGVGFNAASTLRSLAQAKPEIVDKDMLDQLIEFITTNSDASLSNARLHAVTALGYLTQAKPEIVDKDMLNQLIEFVVTKSDASLSNERTNAASTLRLLAQAKIVDKDMFNQLIDFIITDSDVNLYFVRSNLAIALGAFAQAKPEIVDKDMLNQLIGFVITNPDASLSDVCSNAAAALGTLAQAKPETVDQDMLNRLIVFVITDSNASLSDVRSSAATTLEFLAQAKPEIVDKDMLNQLIKFVTTNSDTSLSDVRSSAATTLGSLAKTNPETVDKVMLNKLIEFVTTNSDASLYPVRSSAAITLVSLAQAKPEIVDKDMLNKLIEFVTTNPDASLSDVGSNVASALGSLAEAKPKIVDKGMLNKLIKFVTTNSNVSLSSNARLFAATALVSLDIANHQAGEQVEIIPTLINLLQNDVDSAGRGIAARALFEIAIKDPSKNSFIRVEFEKLQTSPKPHLRMIASKAIEMMAIGELLGEARLHPERIEQIKTQLANYQEDNLKFAASIVLDEINKIENTTK